MSAAAGVNGTLCEAELFLASLHSEESDTDAYDLFNTPPNGGLDIPFSARGAAGPMSLTPESLQSQIGFGMSSVGGLDNTRFGNFVDVKDAEARARASSSTLAGMVKMETDNGRRGSNLLSVLDSASKDSCIADAGSVDTNDIATGFGHSVGKVSKPKRERMSHNIIEKKYRTNINDKILQLREIVPALKVAAKREEGFPVTDEDHSKLDGLEPARKLNKASILIKTIEYIKHLENKCAVYRMENLQLKQNNGLSTPDSVRQASHSVPFAASTTVSTQHSADLTSGSSAVTSPANFAQAYPHGYGSTDLSSKILLGGLALTMGATCFGENDDFGNARGLFAMPVFQYSPATNSLTFSNSHGMPVNFGSSMLSLMRLLLFLYAIFRFAMAVFVRSLPRNEKQQEDSSALGKLVQYSDTLVFGTPTGLWSSLKKCLFISRLKYPENTIERVESEIAKCFILKMYSSSSNMWSFICDHYAASTWAKLVKRVDAANALAPKKGHYYGLEWEMITNIMNADIEKTLESYDILETLQRSGNLAYSLRDFIAMVNDSIVASNTIFITTLLMQELMEEPQTDLDSIVENIYDHELKQDKTLELARESFIVLNALFNSSESAAKELLTLMKLDEGIAMENVNKDQLFVLYSVIVRQFIAAGNYDRLLNYVSKMPLSYLNVKDCSLVGAAALYLVLRYLVKNEKQFQSDSTLCILEELASKLRVWFGSDAGNVLDLEVRGKLINYCVDIALQSNEKLAGDLSSSSSGNEDESDSELSDDEKLS